jgi:hypothetical protein
MREPEARSGKIWAWHAPGGRKGKQRSAVWVEVMVEPFGMRTEMPGLAGRLLVWGAWAVINMPVAPVSAIAWEVKGGEEA